MSDHPTKSPADRWAEGRAYEPYIGRWSRLVARELLGWLALPPEGKWLDVGCGTGALARAVVDLASPAYVKGIDRSGGFIEYARKQPSGGQVEFEIGDAQALPVIEGTYDVSVSGLLLNFLPDPEQAIREMRRAVRPGGTVAVYVWDYAVKMQLLRHFWNAAAALDPNAINLDEGRRFPLCSPEPLTRLFSDAGLANIEVKEIVVPTDFKDFDDYWMPFLGGQGPAPGYVQSLSESSRTALRERIRMGLPFALDGSIPLFARAWAIRGVRPLADHPASGPTI